MSNKVENALISWVENNFRHKRHIHISWFGGEPLLAKGTISRLSDGLQKFCEKINATYSSSMTTNGFFLDREFQAALPSLGIKSVQVTLDGDKEEHDSLRKQRNGEGSFEYIFNNIVTFCENVKDCQLTLRINCGDANYGSIKKLMSRFPPLLKKKRLYFSDGSGPMRRAVFVILLVGSGAWSHSKVWQVFI